MSNFIRHVWLICSLIQTKKTFPGTTHPYLVLTAARDLKNNCSNKILNILTVISCLRG